MINITVKPNQVAVEPLTRSTVSPTPKRPIAIPYDHNKLGNRELPNQHPIKAITGLREELDAKPDTEDLSQVAFSGEMNDLLTTLPTILYCGTSTEVVDIC